METYNLVLLILGIAFLGATWLPALLHGRALSIPILYLLFGYVVFSLPLPLEAPDPLEHGELAEHLAELGVIAALTSAGLKIDRPVGWVSWSSTWRLLAVTMPLCIGGAMLLGGGVAGLAPASALLLGAVLAPTDPVLAADVQAPPPGEGESRVRFNLTSEAGLNDGLAFPFTNAALAMAVAGAPAAWLGGWLLNDVLYKVGVGVGMGLLIGYLLAQLLLSTDLSAESRLRETSAGILALVITLLTYGATELIHGYGFLAVFVASLMVRRHERTHEYHTILHNLSEQFERLLMVVILVLFGGSLAIGLLDALTWQAALVGLIFLLLIRPLTGLLALVGSELSYSERAAVSFFGIRGIGSFFYLAHALNEAEFSDPELLWALVGFVVLTSIVLHGITASSAMRYVE